MSLANTHAAVIEHLIMFADRFFPGEVNALENKKINKSIYNRNAFILRRSTFT